MLPENFPGHITVGQAKEFAHRVISFLNDKLDEDTQIENVVTVSLHPGSAKITQEGRVDTAKHLWGRGHRMTAASYHSTNDHIPMVCHWVSELGLDPERVIGLKMYGNYVQVEGRTSLPDNVRVLRSDGTGFHKYIVDVPIIENGETQNV